MPMPSLVILALMPLAEWTHPDEASPVDPLYFVKRVGKFFFIPSLWLAIEYSRFIIIPNLIAKSLF
jgi:hypothetical protein